MTIIPERISAGLTLDKSVVLTAYPASAWALTVSMRGPGSIDIEAEQNGENYRLLVPASITEDWEAGRYWYSARVSDQAGNKFEVESGEVVIEPDLASASAGYENYSHAERVLSAIEAVLEKRATRDQEKYVINNRELWRTPIADLLVLRDRYRSQVRMERKAKRGDLFGTAVRVVFR